MEPLNRKGFTILEILIVIFLIGVFSTILFFAFNSLDIIKRTRDSKRINDLQVLNSAIKVLINQNPDVFLGNENIIYLSLPDTNSNCSSYLSKLPPLYFPFSYRCVNSNDFRKINGQGWLPLDFSNLLLGISSLPIDPLNSSDYFYAYIKKGNKYKLTAKMESENFALMMINDGGIEPLLYEIGSDLRIPNPHSGLVLYLPFEEGTGTTTSDLSGYNNNGFLRNFDFNSSSGWVKGKAGWGLQFDGINDWIEVNNSLSLQIAGDLSIIFWAYPTDIAKGRQNPLGKAYGGEFDLTMETSSSLSYYHGSAGENNGSYMSCTAANIFSNNNWVMVGITRNNYSRKISYYKNKILTPSNCNSWQNPSQSNRRLGIGYEYAGYFKGVLDEIRIYNRTLSSSEIVFLYESAK